VVIVYNNGGDKSLETHQKFLHPVIGIL